MDVNFAVTIHPHEQLTRIQSWGMPHPHQVRSKYPYPERLSRVVQPIARPITPYDAVKTVTQRLRTAPGPGYVSCAADDCSCRRGSEKDPLITRHLAWNLANELNYQHLPIDGGPNQLEFGNSPFAAFRFTCKGRELNNRARKRGMGNPSIPLDSGHRKDCTYCLSWASQTTQVCGGGVYAIPARQTPPPHS